MLSPAFLSPLNVDFFDILHHITFRLSGRIADDAVYGGRTAFSPQEENTFVIYLKYLQSIGFVM